MTDKISELKAQLKERLDALRDRLAELEQKRQAGAPADRAAARSSHA